MTKYRLIENGYEYSIEVLTKKYWLFGPLVRKRYMHDPYWQGLREPFCGSKLGCNLHIEDLQESEAKRCAKWEIVDED